MQTNEPKDYTTTCANCDDYRNRANTEMHDLEERIALLKAKGKDLTNEAKSEFDDILTSLESNRTSFSSYLADLTDKAEVVWDDVKDEAEDKWSKLRDAIEKAFSKYS